MLPGALPLTDKMAFGPPYSLFGIFLSKCFVNVAVFIWKCLAYYPEPKFLAWHCENVWDVTHTSVELTVQHSPLFSMV